MSHMWHDQLRRGSRTTRGGNEHGTHVSAEFRDRLVRNDPADSDTAATLIATQSIPLLPHPAQRGRTGVLRPAHGPLHECARGGEMVEPFARHVSECVRE